MERSARSSGKVFASPIIRAALNDDGTLLLLTVSHSVVENLPTERFQNGYLEYDFKNEPTTIYFERVEFLHCLFVVLSRLIICRSSD